MEVLQVKEELTWTRERYMTAQPKRVLEIGCWDGGTLREWLKTGPDVVVAVDLEHRNEKAYARWRKPHTELVVVTGSSQSWWVADAIRAHAPYDWIYIDGDHDTEPVRHDRDLCLPLLNHGGSLLFHDISEGAGQEKTGPRLALEELRTKGYDIAEYVRDPGRWPWAHGVGVVQV